MISLTVNLGGDNAWPDLRDKGENLIWLSNGAPPIQIAVLDMGMKSGRPSCAIRIDMPDGKTVIAETSVRLLLVAAKAIESRYPGVMNT